MKPIVADVTKTGDSFQFEDKWAFTQAMKRLPDGKYQIRLGPRKRSLSQNAWHWAEAVPKIAEAVGYEPDDDAGRDLVHYALVAKCFGTTWNEQLKQDVPNVRSSHLTTDEFSQLMEWEVRYAAKEFGVLLVLPDERGTVHEKRPALAR